MPRTSAVNLTEERIARAKCPKGRASSYLWSLHPTGFGLRIYASGRKTYVFRAYPDGRQEIVAIGDADRMSLKAARETAYARAAGNPADDRRKVPTLARAFDEALEVRSIKLKPSTIADYRKVAGTYMAALLPERLDALTTVKVTQWYKAVQAKSPSKAAYGARILRMVFNYMIRSRPELKLNNPVGVLSAARLLSAPPPRRRLIPADRLGAWWKAIHALNADARDYALVCLLVGFRRTAALRMRWSDFDAERQTYCLATEDAKNREEFEYPLGPYVTSIIARRKAACGDSPWVFPSRQERREGQPAVGYDTALKVASGRIGLRFSAHDLRRTRATIAGTMGLSTIVLKRLLTHKLDAAPIADATTGGYFVSTTEQLRPHVVQVERRILEASGITDLPWRLRVDVPDEEGNIAISHIDVDMRGIMESSGDNEQRADRR